MEPVRGGKLAQVPERAEKLFKEYELKITMPLIGWLVFLAFVMVDIIYRLLVMIKAFSEG